MKMAAKRTYYKLSYGPDHFGWFDSHDDLHEAFPRFREHLIETGVIRLTPDNLIVVPPGEKPTSFLVEAIEMTPEEYRAIPASTAKWLRGAI